MTMPKFTAEAALYQTSGQYRTGSQMIHSSARMTSPITPADIPSEVPIEIPGGEDIYVYGEAPGCPLGWMNIGGTCVLEGSGGGPGTVGQPGGGAGGGPGGGVGGGPMTPPKKPARPPKKSPSTKSEFKPRAGEACHVIRFFAPPKWRAVRKDGVYRGPYSGGDWICEDSDPGHEPGSDIRCGTTWAEEGEFYTDGCYNGSI